MSDSSSRRKLARAAARLGAAHGCLLPPLVLMTDDERLEDPLGAARALPRGSMVVVRTRDPDRRRELTRRLVELSRWRGLFVLVAGDPALAAVADGLHLPEARMKEAAHWRARCPRLLITASIHSLAGLRNTAFVDALFLSPVFPTASHPGRAALTPVRANQMARLAAKPVYALGGLTAGNALRLSPRSFSGLAAIGALKAVDP